MAVIVKKKRQKKGRNCLSVLEEKNEHRNDQKSSLVAGVFMCICVFKLCA